MKNAFRAVAVVVVLAGTFEAGRASNLWVPMKPHAMKLRLRLHAKPVAAASAAAAATGAGAQVDAPWAREGFRDAECQIVGDIADCE